MMMEESLSRVYRLIGVEGVDALKHIRVIIFGIGGVGSWCAEALIRSGVAHITLVDADNIATSNINRQLMATSSTVGQSKVAVLASRLRDISVSAQIEPLHKLFTRSTLSEFDLGKYDVVIDAIDSLSDKALLINTVTRLKGLKLYSSMGAAMKLTSQRIKVAEFWKVSGCPLAAALRRRFKKSGIMPARKFKCVYSDELIPNQGEICSNDDAMTFNKVAYNGALCHITAIFGMTLASLVIEDLLHSLDRSNGL